MTPAFTKPVKEKKLILQPPQKGLVLGPGHSHRRAPAQVSPTCLQETKGHTAQEVSTHGRADTEVVWVCVLMKGGCGSPGSDPVMSLSLPGPQSQPVTRDHASSPRRPNQKCTNEQLRMGRTLLSDLTQVLQAVLNLFVKNV